MTEFHDDDWETLNAYLDGELPEPERRAFIRRLARDRVLVAAAADLRAQSESLRRMQPVSHTGPPAWIRPAAWAGSIAALLIVVAILIVPGTDGTDLISIHESFLDQSFPA